MWFGQRKQPVYLTGKRTRREPIANLGGVLPLVGAFDRENPLADVQKPRAQERNSLKAQTPPPENVDDRHLSRGKTPLRGQGKISPRPAGGYRTMVPAHDDKTNRTPMQARAPCNCPSYVAGQTRVDLTRRDGWAAAPPHLSGHCSYGGRRHWRSGAEAAGA